MLPMVEQPPGPTDMWIQRIPRLHSDPGGLSPTGSGSQHVGLELVRSRRSGPPLVPVADQHTENDQYHEC